MEKVFDFFGVACFHFTYIDDRTDAKAMRSFQEDAVKALSAIENVSEIEAFGIDAFRSRSISPPISPDAINGPICPHPANGEISFDIYIPQKVQEQVYSRKARLPCENFHVTIRYDGPFPVAFVAPGVEITIDTAYGASEYVPIVREYLVSRWPSDAPLRFYALGPSPFHAEFYEMSNDDGELGGINIVASRGYDRIFFSGDTVDDEIRFQDEITTVIGKFYETVYFGLAIQDVRRRIVIKAASLLQRLNEKNILKIMKNTIIQSTRSDLAQIHSDLFFIEEEMEEFKRSLSNDREKFSDPYQNSPLWRYVDKEVETMPIRVRSQVDHITRLAELFETSGANNRAILTAAIVSAALTVIATLTPFAAEKMAATSPHKAPASGTTAPPANGKLSSTR